MKFVNLIEFIKNLIPVKIVKDSKFMQTKKTSLRSCTVFIIEIKRNFRNYLQKKKIWRLFTDWFFYFCANVISEFILSS